MTPAEALMLTCLLLAATCLVGAVLTVVANIIGWWREHE